ncbi:MAG: hypothetical protein JWN33_388 [Candidatus Saccharibacteria bacterium]|nr:hypothetical protein [Candidatus Saccharibacteria bacterium]
MNDFVRTPTETDYRAAIELVDDTLQRDGGAWVSAMRPEMYAKYSEEAKDFLAALSNLTAGSHTLVEGPELPSPVPARRALRYGYQIGLEVTDILYSSHIRLDHISDAMQKIITVNRSDDKETNRITEQAEIIKTIGEAGLELLDFGSQLAVERWSDEAVAEVYLRRIYTLGCGAILCVAHSYHDAIMDGICEREVAKANWDDLLPPNPGEK